MAIKNENLKLISNTIRTLSMDAIQKANSGHPGMPMGCADIAAVLWYKIMKYNPEDPKWFNRDRFILSAGHGSMLLYSILHLSGYNISLDDIKNFRQLNSNTPGHPENTVTDGIETTTGPLGQGFANGVGMGLASKLLSEEFNKNKNLIDHYIYAIAGDGCLMEGITSEAASIAGHLGLGNLIYFFDSNDISIEGSTDLTCSDDMTKKFQSFNWHVQTIDGHNFSEIEKAITKAQKEKNKPSLIIARTTIAMGSPNKAGSESTHGAPLGEDEIIETKKNLGLNPDDKFHVPEKVYEILKNRKEELQKVYKESQKLFNNEITGQLKEKWDKYFTTPDIENIRKNLPHFDVGDKVATRSASGKVLEKLFNDLPNIVGGSADLAPSNKTFIKGHSESGKNTIGRNIHFGIREHAMGAIQNGIAYYGGFIPYSATFLVFMDYMRPPIRLAALAELNSIFVMTHDSFFVGEDGPTHQPIEHIASARAIPHLNVIRPADAEETKEAWLEAISREDGPTLLSLTRQNIPVLQRDEDSSAKNLSRGAYIIKKNSENPDTLIMASGSEVHVAIEACELLKQKNISANVVSFPCWELFDKQTKEYQKDIIMHGIPKVVIEAGIKMGWEKYAGPHALFITKEGFGSSAPGDELAEKYGFTSEVVSEKIIQYLKKK